MDFFPFKSKSIHAVNTRGNSNAGLKRRNSNAVSVNVTRLSSNCTETRPRTRNFPSTRCVARRTVKFRRQRPNPSSFELRQHAEHAISHPAALRRWGVKEWRNLYGNDQKRPPPNHRETQNTKPVKSVGVHGYNRRENRPNQARKP